MTWHGTTIWPKGRSGISQCKERSPVHFLRQDFRLIYSSSAFPRAVGFKTSRYFDFFYPKRQMSMPSAHARGGARRADRAGWRKSCVNLILISPRYLLTACRIAERHVSCRCRADGRLLARGDSQTRLTATWSIFTHSAT